MWTRTFNVVALKTKCRWICQNIWPWVWESSLADFPIKRFLSLNILSTTFYFFCPNMCSCLSCLTLSLSFISSIHLFSIVFFQCSFPCRKPIVSKICNIQYNASKAWWRSQQIPNNFCKKDSVTTTRQTREILRHYDAQDCDILQNQNFRETSLKCTDSFLSKMCIPVHITKPMNFNRFIRIYTMDLYTYEINTLESSQVFNNGSGFNIYHWLMSPFPLFLKRKNPS